MAKAFHGPDAAVKYERAGKWLLATVFGRKMAEHWCEKNAVPIVKAQVEGIGTSGGFLVPGELEAAILDLRDSYGSFRRRACVYPMASDSAAFPRRTGTAAATFFGEGVAATSTSTNMDQVKLTAKKLGAIVTLSSELGDDAIVDMVDYITTELAWALAVKEDDCAFNGDGTSIYGGMRGLMQIVLDGGHAAAKVTAAATHNTFLTLDSTDLANLMGQIQASAYARAAWFVSSIGFSQCFSRLAMVAGGTLSMGVVDGLVTPFFNGFPVILTQKLPTSSASLTGTGMMAFGDMYGAAVLGQRRGMTIAVSDERYFDIDQIAILATERFDAVIHDLGDATAVGSMAVLVAP